MRKFLIATMLGIGALSMVSGAAYAKGDHHEEQDGCDHGHTGKDCKPDPQPDHGKDCDKHGNHGGINEDHCATTTTTTAPPTTTTTAPEVTTTTTVPVTTTSVPEQSQPVSTPAPTVQSEVVTPAPTPEAAPVPAAPAPAAPAPVKSLPHTGGETEALTLLGFGMTLFGSGIRYANKGR